MTSTHVRTDDGQMPGGVGILKLQIVRRIIGLVIRVVISATDQNIGEDANGLVATVSSLASDWVI